MNQGTGTAAVEFSLEWKSSSSLHRDRIFFPKINFWRDLLPREMEIPMNLARKGEVITQQFRPGGLIQNREDTYVRIIPENGFNKHYRKRYIEPRRGMFYPRGVAASAIGCFPQDVRPFRIIEMTGDQLIIDLNHPLAGIDLSLSATILERNPVQDERGGSLNLISEIVTENGPGMQASINGVDTDFFFAYPFSRESEEEDSTFYQKPRLVHHLDEIAIGQVTRIYETLLQPDMKILDLMASWDSHIPSSLKSITVTGLGMNLEELKANNRLSTYFIHDLNEVPKLPFKDEEFDAVICTVSVEYLTHPIEVFRDTARILKKGGIFLNSFSERWFPPKVIKLWSELHPFERMGLVIEYYKKAGRFIDLHTESIRGYPRPSADKYAPTVPFSDPVYAVWGARN
jgi:hypothetical protein